MEKELEAVLLRSQMVQANVLKALRDVLVLLVQ